MPNRILKESICASATLDALTADSENFFYRLIVNCDDYGLMDARPVILRAKCYPLRETLSSSQISAMLDDLVRVGLVSIYEADGRPYLRIVTWGRHQQIRAAVSKCPIPPGFMVSDRRLIAIASNGNHPQSDVPVIQSNPIQSNPIQSESIPGDSPEPEPKKRDPKLDLLIADVSPELQNELQIYYAGKSYRTPIHFKSIQQRDSYRKALAALGPQAKDLIIKGLARERYSLSSLLSWLETCVKNNLENHDKPTNGAYRKTNSGPSPARPRPTVSPDRLAADLELKRQRDAASLAPDKH